VEFLQCPTSKILAARDACDLAHAALQTAAQQYQIKQLISKPEMLPLRKHIQSQHLNDLAAVVVQAAHLGKLALKQAIHVIDSLRIERSDDLAAHLHQPLS
jgi:hypothetical protein